MKAIKSNILERKIILTESDDSQFQLLSIEEIFAFFARKNSPYSGYEIDDNLSKVSFCKQYVDLFYEIIFKSEISDIKFYCKFRGLIEVSRKEIEEALALGYIIVNNVWLALSVDSLNEFKMLSSIVPSGNTINSAFAFNLINNPDLNFQIRNSFNLKEEFEKNFKNTVSEPNSSFVKNLYGYQEKGLSWLKFCTLNKIGTILGDDMGLGKTAQIIALISWSLQHRILDKILIVVPTTLIENWRREFLFFAPSIVPYIHHGSLRAGISQNLKEENVIITSYSLIINDFHLLNEIRWDLTVLDEAGLIKNPESERTKKIKALNSKVRIGMTGTPVENSLTDLWSIADYVQPNFLGSLDEFKTNYIGNTINDTLSKNLSPLKDRVSQIMLRRMKIDILTDLPEKIDIHQALVMNDSEKVRYEQIKNEIINSVNGSKSHTFKLINYLRQFTTHPLLLNRDSNANEKIINLSSLSRKFERTIELLDDIKAREEKVLVFTGYIEMIDLFIKYLAPKYDVKIFNIDGRLGPTERQLQIDEFSKVLGFSVMILNPTTAAVGLNITAANHVIHYTRQWNPAIEIQASARSYRNGQKKAVNIYYLYYAESIEEVIDLRLRDKESLSGEIIQPIQHEEDELNEILKVILNS